jgi:serine/threonine protein kinase
MCILTEFMPSGSLADILPNATIKLEWKKRLKMLRSAAVGINYLHSLEPCIIHRDLKPSNLLVRSLPRARSPCACAMCQMRSR